VPVPQESFSQQQARELLGLSASDPIFLHVGSFRSEKNHMGLLQIFRRILRTIPDAKLLLVGDGSLRAKTVQAAEACGIIGQVRWEGLQKNVWPYYRAADVFLFPSITEGFGIALAESALAGLPIVASDIPAHREAVPAAQHKFLFTQGDYDRAAVLAIEQLAAARDRTNPWVAASEEHARSHFTIERFAQEVGDAYESVRKAA
jgi:glycosyltransferase involved in cell wall biosynthesis